MKNREQKFKNLEDWANSLLLTIKNTLPEMRDILDGKGDLPPNCPSKESMAELAFGQVEKKLHEVNAAAKAIRGSIFE